jgi:hypothetical protein
VAAHARAAVAGELDEIERVRERKRARQIGEEDDARLERADEQRLAARVVPCDVGGELLDARAELTAREVDLADPRIGGLYEARSRRKC